MNMRDALHPRIDRNAVSLLARAGGCSERSADGRYLTSGGVSHVLTSPNRHPTGDGAPRRVVIVVRDDPPDTLAATSECETSYAGHFERCRRVFSKI